MELPMLVIVKVPWASGVQLADNWMVGASVAVMVGVAVGNGQKVLTVAGAAPPPDVSSSSVPNNPAVRTVVDCPAASWKELLAIGVPLSSKVYVPAVSISVPRLVIVNVPCASGVQVADNEITGPVVCAWTG